MSASRVVKGRKCAGKAEGGKNECGKCGRIEALMEVMRLRMDEMSKVRGG